MQLLADLARSERTIDDFSTLMRYLVQVLGVEHLDLVRERIVELAPEAETIMTSAAETWIQQGLEKGREEGRDLAKRDVLQQLLTTKFGPVTEATERRISSATPAELDTFLLGFVSATRIEDVLG